MGVLQDLEGFLGVRGMSPRTGGTQVSHCDAQESTAGNQVWESLLTSYSPGGVEMLE
jgi:hypothetical protein